MKRDLKINFYILEEIVDEIQKYSSALEEMERASSSVINMLGMNESQGIEELKKLYQGFEKELKKCREELQDLGTILSGYTNEMQAIIRPNNKQSFMRVDRNDIWFNKEQIIYDCDNIGYALSDHNLGWDEFSFGKSDEKKHREQRNYAKMEQIWENVIPRFMRRLGAQIDAINDVYTRKVIPFENKDDEYQFKATRLYNKYTNLWESIRTDISDDINMVADLVHGVFDAIIDLIAGMVGLAWGIISYSAAVDVLVLTYPLNIQPKWAEEVIDDTNSVVGSILKDPMLVVEGFAQQASDAFEEEGAAYALGYVAGDLLGGKGLGKLAKLGKARVLEKAEVVDDFRVKRNVLDNGADEVIEGTGKLKGDLLEKSTCNINELTGYLKKIDEYNGTHYTDEFVSSDKWPGDIQIPKSPSVLTKEGTIDWTQVPNDGFAVIDGTLDKKVFDLKINKVLDRYGPTNGKFASPVIDGKPYPYDQRALPYVEDVTKYHKYKVIGDFSNIETYIKNLDDLELKADIEAYMDYKKLNYKDLVVYRGGIAEGFGVPGGGIQYQLPLPIDILIDLKLLEEVN